MSADPNCLFCKIVAGEIPAERLYEDEHVIAFNDISPKAPVHFLVIPKRHISTLDDVEPGDAQVMGQLFVAAKQIAREMGIGESGYRAIINCKDDGGQEVHHIHLHVLGGQRMRHGLG